MRRCPVPEVLFAEERFELSEELTRYLCVVLRLSEGDAFTGFNGLGWERDYELERAEGSWRARGLGAPRRGRRGAPLSLCYGVPKGDKLDLVTRQVTELGVGALELWAASRSVAIWKRDKLKSKLARLERVSSEAARQCGRADSPLLSPPALLSELIERHAQTPHRLYLDPRAALTLRELELKRGEVALLVGPEGGLSPEELEALEGAGWQGLALSCPVLRTETAAVVGVALTLEAMAWL